MAGHCHPAVISAVEEKLATGTMFGMPHELEWELAEEICKRFPVEMVRFGNSGTEVTMHALRLAARRPAAIRLSRWKAGITACTIRSGLGEAEGGELAIRAPEAGPAARE